VHIETADMRALPFTDATFDLVVSSLAIHNVRSNADRKRAISEAFRVLKPGGRMVIADIRATAIYADALRTLGASNVERHRLGWRFWWGIRSPPQLSSRLQNPKFEDLQRVSETIHGRQAFLFVGAARA
jgi:ubiquinone/menaquinone biosynthesis C-methylase UbiE